MNSVIKNYLLKSEIDFYVYYEDSDFSGFMYHANYLKFFERAREHLIGIDNIKQWYIQGYHFVVAHIDIKYLNPAKHGDLIKIKSECAFNRSPLVLFYQKAYIKSINICEAKIKLALLNKENRAVKLPDFIFNSLKDKSLL